ncbi:MAG: hypothetical protein JJ863_27935 [Deltaproteobacteria bacterium]|nr:hypothetical protein [Deltaproteobacteria bacterium]
MRLHTLAILLCALMGCADDNVSVFITGMAIPEVSDGVCDYTGGTMLSNGVYDPSRGNSYILFASVDNALIPRANELRPETNGVFITDAVVNVIDVNSGASLSEYSVPATGYIPPGSTSFVSMEAIPSSIDVSASTQLILEVSLRGQTQGEIEIETGSFSWPVSVCSGCLFPACMMTSDGTVDESLGLCSPGSNFQLITACP